MTETALTTELTHTLFEEATSDNISRVLGRRCLVDTCVISIPLHMPIPAVTPLATSASLEVSKNKHMTMTRYGKEGQETPVAFEIVENE